MKNKTYILLRRALAFSMLLLAPVGIAMAGGPNFGAAIYGDDQVWGTKGTTDLPAPNDHNEQSFDGLFKFTNGVAGQLAVSEAAPGNPMYNGGRWDAYTVTWTGVVAPYLITNYEDLIIAEALGYLTITEGDPDAGGMPHYFQCPLLPAKDA